MPSGECGGILMDYNATITVPATPQEAYSAIAEGMSGWWTSMSAPFLEPGDRARTDFGGESYWVFEAVTLDGPGLVELRCCEANHIHEGLPDRVREEWLGTVLVFEIREAAAGTSITLTHKGLHDGLVCYEVCEAGWNHFFLKRLAEYLDN